MTRKCLISTLPPVLILQLKYFKYSKEGGVHKIMKTIACDVELQVDPGKTGRFIGFAADLPTI